MKLAKSVRDPPSKYIMSTREVLNPASLMVQTRLVLSASSLLGNKRNGTCKHGILEEESENQMNVDE